MVGTRTFSEIIDEMVETGRRRDTEAADSFKENFNVILASHMDLDHEDLIDAYQEYYRPLSNVRLMVEHSKMAELLRKEIIRRMESC